MPKQPNSSQTYLAFDFGERRTGVAVGQSITQSASPVTTILSINHQPNWQTIEKLVNDWRPDMIIVGIPEDRDENKSIRNKIKLFCTQLSQISNLPVRTHDETLTSDEAYQQLKVKRQENKGKIDKKNIDQLAAAILLESWMNVNLKR